MKNKIITFLVLISFILPSISQAFIFLPTANLTIIVNTQAQDSAFIFNSSDGDQFTLQTENLTASLEVKIIAFGAQYSLFQNNVDGLKIEDINCVSDNESDIISYTENSAIFIPMQDENITCTFNNVKNVGKTPVLIVPGLIGTDLIKGQELLWADIPRMINPLNTDSFIDPLAFNSNMISIAPDIITSGVIKSKNFGPFSFDYSEGLISQFAAEGYVENETLFTFPYDWRYGVTGEYADGKTNSDLLSEKIQEILAQTGSDKVDIVAHSMGGLIVKKYVVDNLASHHIGKAVFVGVPSTGAPKSIKNLLQGDNLGVIGLNDEEIKKISENMPAIYDLLPSQQYYNNKGSYVKVVDQSFTGLNTITKDLTYSEVNTFLTNDHALNSIAVSNAENLHTATFDNFDLRAAGVDLYAIDGCKTGTLGKITEVKSKTIFGQPVISYKKPGLVPGDGTVPLESATNLPIDADHKFYSLNASHGTMMTQDGSRQQIVNIIAGSSLAVDGAKITQNIDECKLNGKAISVFSPVNISATDQYGNKMGLAEDGSVMNEIPGGDFEIWGEHKFLYLPTDGGQVYDIAIDGTGTGTYTIKTDDIQNGEEVKTQEFRDLPVTSDLTGTINLGASGVQDSLTIKQHTNSQAETILPSPPQVVIEFDPVAKDLKFSSPEPTVSVVDQDDVITFKDQAGNVVELKLKDKNRKKSMIAEIKSLKYNGVLVDVSRNAMEYKWKLDKNKNITELSQHVKSRKEYNINADFNGKNTKLEGRDVSGKIKKTEAGLRILKINIDIGDFDWSY